MNYKLEKATNDDIVLLKKYKLNTIFEYAKDLDNEEVKRINDYVDESIPMQIDKYKIICVDNKKIGCLLIENMDDGILLDEVFLEDDYRNKGIGTEIIKSIISSNDIIYLWVYKLNKKAVSLYRRLGFIVVKESDTRYYMKCSN